MNDICEKNEAYVEEIRRNEYGSKYLLENWRMEATSTKVARNFISETEFPALAEQNYPNISSKYLLNDSFFN